MAPDVMTLREFRDDVLLESALGKAFVHAYYKLSPPAAEFISRHNTLRAATRMGLAPLVFGVKHPSAAGFGLIGIAAACLVLVRSRKKK
jgi:hypothetical protein